MIKRYITLVILVSFFGFGHVYAISQEELTPLPSHRLSTIMMTKIIEQNHYKQTRLNDEHSMEIFDDYLKNLDPNRNIFTQKDVDRFSRYKLRLDDALLGGDLKPAFEIFSKFNQRRIERAEYAIKQIDTKFDFSLKESYLFDRAEAQWPADKKALDGIWRRRVKNDYLTLLLEDKTEQELKKTLTKRYQRIIKRSKQFKSEDVYEVFINSYLRNIEPHTAYFSPRTSENFTINMSLSLEGIGAALQTEDEHTVVKRIIKGGPADLSGLLHAGDKIIGVGQGSGEVEDIVGWRLDDVVGKIRGPKDSVVQLHILPEHSNPGGSNKYITLVRNKIKLEDQQVKKSVLDIPDGKFSKKIGVIEIPTFYMDFAASARGEKDYSSTTRDTRIIIKELMAENVDGIVVDLRKNGGGSLIEAVSLTGLFIKSGPVVQIRNSNGKIRLNQDEDKSIAYSGPLTVLVDRYSASASEIFAGAIQDYGRGIIVGEPTFGKGTVQSIIDLNNYVDKSDNTLGKLKLTMAQFFRVNGDSTQHRGVVPDIVFPTSTKSDDQGERALENALPWAKIPAANIHGFHQIPENLQNVKMLHESRTKVDKGFSLLLSQADLRHKMMEKKEVSLYKTARKDEREKRKISQHSQFNKFRVSRGIKEVSMIEEFAEEKDSDADQTKQLNDEVQLILLREAAAILVDVNRLKAAQLSQQKVTDAGHKRL